MRDQAAIEICKNDLDCYAKYYEESEKLDHMISIADRSVKKGYVSVWDTLYLDSELERLKRKTHELDTKSVDALSNYLDRVRESASHVEPIVQETLLAIPTHRR